ncbi:MAG: hypothetical protein M0P58_07335 [Bacteroidales bacterium]|jgi:ligand-binding sensor domain-containing protein|nr:hypothetical protein [Bacteroidales bacterium]
MGKKFLYILSGFILFIPPLVSPAGKQDPINFETPSRTRDEKFSYTHLTRENGLPSNRTRCVIQDLQGYVWIGTDNGLVRFDGRNTTVFRPERNDPSSVIDICINALFETRDSLLLIGTFDGLSLYDPVTKKFTGYSIYQKGNARFPLKNITCFYEDRDGSIWIGTENGLVQMNWHPVVFNCFQLSKSEDKISREYHFNFVTCIIQDPRDDAKLLIATMGGLLQFDKRRNVISHDYKKANDPYSPVDLSLDSGRFLWSCGWGSGLNCLDLETGKWQEYPYDQQKPISILGITKKSRNELWLATIDHGLGIFNQSDHSFKFHQKIAGDEKSLLTNSVIKIKYLNNKKDLWILSDEGKNHLQNKL